MSKNSGAILEVFSGKKVLITGHTGFKGTWLSRWLQKIGADVRGISIGVPTSPSIFEAIDEDVRCSTTWLDVCQTDALATEIRDYNPDFLFHLAAQPIVLTALVNPLETWRTNTLGTVSILEALRVSKIEGCVAILVTSDKVYRNYEWAWGYRETDELGGSDPYSASKAGAELAIRSYHESKLFEGQGVSLAAARAGNVIGGGDWASGRIVPDAIRAWAAGDCLELRNPTATRPWQHVLEPLSGYLLLAARLSLDAQASGECFNFGPDESASRSVLDVVLGLASRLQMNCEVSSVQATVSESGLLQLSSQKASHVLNWRPQLDFETTLEWTSSWYEGFLADENVVGLMDEQLSEYSERIAMQDSWGAL